ncbi:hypothetical protein FDP41_009985 [Naegleria fowleri]|uniref:Uncharacterized protein n=1 Tax=Naegleria fowleri TaxID=5763 RepID=A0A6A5B981_NAEFO|nr:uncharacterized protein FDP41_009985 [Naegleria fowleri]KAF0971762.1 hypothetical protein FDP41_009985 [Naegleria fowleri]CAG4710015.1 unnamed protein product [Naegleria fowleri]
MSSKKLTKLIKELNSTLDKAITKQSSKSSKKITSSTTSKEKIKPVIPPTREQLIDKINVSDKLKHCIFHPRKIQEITYDILQHTSYPDYSLSIIFCGNKFITKLNEKDRRKKGPTDILSYPTYSPDLEHNFPLMDTEDGPIPKELAAVLANEHKLILEQEKYLGEMVISQPYIVDYCKQKNLSLNHHMALLLTHGVLHLMGYDHEVKKDYLVMRAKEKEILAALEEERGPEEWANLNLLKDEAVKEEDPLPE